MAKPIRALELHYPMIQFFKKSVVLRINTIVFLMFSLSLSSTLPLPKPPNELGS